MRGPLSDRREVCAHESSHAHEFSQSQARQTQANAYLANLLGVSISTSNYRLMPTEVYAQSSAVCMGFGAEFPVPIDTVSCATVAHVNAILAGTDATTNRAAAASKSATAAHLAKTNAQWLNTLRSLRSRGCQVDLSRGVERVSMCPLSVHDMPFAPDALTSAGLAS